MKRYYVLIPPGGDESGMKTLFVRDAFSWIGFLLPVPWLMFRRLWMLSLICLLAYFLGAFAEDWLGYAVLPTAVGIVVSLWIGFEGGHLRAQTLQAKGWTIDDIVAADQLSDAEELYFAGRRVPPEADRMPVPMPSGTYASSRPARPDVALGLIGPYGGR